MNRVLAANHLHIFRIRISKWISDRTDKLAKSRLRIDNMLAHKAYGTHRIHAELLQGRKLHKAELALVTLGNEVENHLLRFAKCLAANVHGTTFFNSHAAVRVNLDRKVLVLKHQVQKVARAEHVIGIHGHFCIHRRKRCGTTRRRPFAKDKALGPRIAKHRFRCKGTHTRQKKIDNKRSHNAFLQLRKRMTSYLIIQKIKWKVRTKSLVIGH